MRTLTILSTLFLLGSTSSAWSATLAVPTQYPTITAALKVAAPGDVVSLAPGRYQESLTLTGLEGVQLVGAGPGLTTLEPAPGDWSILELTSCSNLRIANMTLSQAAAGVTLLDCHGVTLEALELLGATWAVEVQGGSDDITVRGSSFVGGELGVHTLWVWDTPPEGKQNLTVEDCIFQETHNALLIDASVDVIIRRNQILDTGNVAITNNYSVRVEAYENLIDGGTVGLLMNMYDDEYYPPELEAALAARAPVLVSTSDSSFYNNIVLGTTLAGIYGLYYEPGNGRKLHVRNNIFYQNPGAAITGATSSGLEASWKDALELAYNTFYGNGANFTGAISTPPTSSRNLFTDPRFTDPQAGDFTLQRLSTSVNTGTLDINGDGIADLTSYQGRSRDRGMEER